MSDAVTKATAALQAQSCRLVISARADIHWGEIAAVALDAVGYDDLRDERDRLRADNDRLWGAIRLEMAGSREPPADGPTHWSSPDA